MDKHGNCCYCYTPNSDFRIGLVCLDCHRGISRLRDLIADDVTPKDTTSVFKLVEGALHERQKLRERVSSLSELVNMLKNNTPPDILVKSGQDNGPTIPVHRAILASKSLVLAKKVLDTEMLTFPKMNHDELKIFLEFLYKGGSDFADQETFMKHAATLLVNAHEYDILQLKVLCERKMVAALDVGNVLEFLECSKACGNVKLKDEAIKFVKRNKNVVFRSEFDDFSNKNPDLALEVTRACISEQMGFS